MTKAKMSQEEMLEKAARLVAGTINPEAMELREDDIQTEQFIKLFVEKAREMLKEKNELTLAIWEGVNTEKFTSDLEFIIKFIEEESKQKYRFFSGILVYLTRKDLCANWIPNCPL